MEKTLNMSNEEMDRDLKTYKALYVKEMAKLDPCQWDFEPRKRILESIKKDIENLEKLNNEVKEGDRLLLIFKRNHKMFEFYLNMQKNENKN